MARIAIRLLLAFALLSVSSGARAETTAEPLGSEPASAPDAYTLRFDHDRPRNYWLPPLASFLLPGLDQWWEKQVGYGVAYTGAASVGAATGLLVPTQETRVRTLAGLVYQASGSVSAYHAFRTAAASRQAQGEFSFLRRHETPQEVLLAPFQFKYALRPTTFIGIPAHLLVAFLLVRAQGLSTFTSPNWHVPGVADFFYSGADSYCAGTGEEAVFRGWLLPMTRQWTGSDWASVAITGVTFGALHYRPGYIPLSQTLAGLYFGWLTQRNNWEIGEAVFQHFWFDTVVILLSYASANQIQRSEMTFAVSPISIQF